MNKIVTVLCFGILIGCVTSQVLQPLVIPPANANQKKRWENKCVNYEEANVDMRVMKFSTDKGWVRIMNKFGSEGWEVEQYFYNGAQDITQIVAICFKREA